MNGFNNNLSFDGRSKIKITELDLARRLGQFFAPAHWQLMKMADVRRSHCGHSGKISLRQWPPGGLIGISLNPLLTQCETIPANTFLACDSCEFIWGISSTGKAQTPETHLHKTPYAFSSSIHSRTWRPEFTSTPERSASAYAAPCASQAPSRKDL